MATIQIIRTDGTEETHELSRARLMDTIHKFLNCDCVDTVNLRDGRVMIVDDDGLGKGLPVNAKATALYKMVTIPNDNKIVGDVAIAVDEDFA